MNGMSDDLTGFLRARLDEDEQYAQGPWGDDGYSEYNEPGTPGHHLRVLAEVDAKRRILDASNMACPPACLAEHSFSGSCGLRWMGPLREENGSRWVLDDTGLRVAPPPAIPEWALRLLALPYADHPDYRTEWAPEA
jgi:hypothetical protein